NYDSDIVDFYVDAAAPEIDVTSPDENEHFASDSVTVEWGGIDETSGIDYYEVMVDNGNWINVGSATNHIFSNLTDGEHLVKVRAWDNAGNNNTDTVNFTVDVTSPELNIIAPQQNEIFSESNITVEWEGSDSTTGIDFYEVRIDGENWIDLGTDTEHTFTGLQDGEHTVEVRAWDEVGNQEIMSVDFTVDTTPPEVEIISPGDGETLNETEVTIEWSGDDDGTGIDHYQVMMDNGSWIDVGSGTSHTFSEVEEGEHTVEVQAVDGAGNLDSASVDFEVSVEEEEPMIVVHDFAVEPTDGEAPLDVEITARLENEGNAEGNITLLVDSEEIETWTIGPGGIEEIEHTYELEEGGTYTITLGNQSETVIVEEEYTIIIGPIKDQNGNLINDAHLSLSWGEEEEIEIEDGTSGFYNFTLMATTTPNDLEFTYTVEHDSLEESETGTFTGLESGDIILDLGTDDQASGEGMFLVDYWWVSLLLIIILVIIIFGIFWKMKKKPEEEMTEEPIDSEKPSPSLDENGGLSPSDETTGEEEFEEDKEQAGYLGPNNLDEEPSSFNEPPISKSKEDEESIPPEEESIISLLEENTDEEKDDKEVETSQLREEDSKSKEGETSKSNNSDLKEFVKRKVEEVITFEDDVTLDEVMDKVMETVNYQDDSKKMKNTIYAELSFYSEGDNEDIRRVSKEITERAVEDKD
ncbi:MAG: Ig-like domain-containing protein, partial [Candidatus Thermoplasmatota archaeon]